MSCMSRKLIGGVCVVMFSNWVAASDDSHSPDRAESTPPARGFLYKELALDGETHAYSVFVPPQYTPEKSWPVIVFLHGSGERGRDGFLQTDVGIGRAIRRNPERCPAIVVMPQCPPERSWTGKMVHLVLQCVARTSQEYKLDPQRMYLTGLSLGGAGTWHIGARMSGQFAALAPICGFGTPTEAKSAAKIPIWCFHGAADEHVPVQRSREMIDAIRAAGGNPRYTEYPTGSHNVWDRVYQDAEFWRWLFQQKRGSVVPVDRGD